ncbi:MAG: acyl-CoA thioesterase [Muribaculaceae bacterium]|nr:acyl-CoA thioesterase [Muribaculaceae bacterium]
MSNSRIPAPAFPFRHHKAVQLRFLDIDPMGHLNNAIYFQLMDTAKVDYFTALGAVFDGKTESLVIVNVNCSFYSPTYLSENVEVLTTVDHIGEKSLRLEQRVVNADNGDVKCICHTVMAGFNPATATSVVISDDWHRKISAYEGRTL